MSGNDAMDVVDEEEALAIAMSMSAGEATTATASTAADDAADYVAAAKEIADAENEVDGAAPQIHTNTTGEWEEEMVPVPVNSGMLSQLVDMGIPDVRARKGLVHGGNVDGAIAWIGEHQDDADIDQPYMVRKIDTLPKPELSEEEKKIRLEAVKERIKTRREERAKQEKADEIRLEKDRRQRGQNLDVTMEERQKAQRKRELDKAKREKDEQAKERSRLKAEIARDKEIRRLNKGVLPSVLGVDGYNPSIIQYDKPVDGLPADAVPATASSSKPPPAAAVAAPSAAKKAPTGTATASAGPVTEEERLAKVDQAIGMISRYRAAGDGGNALKLLLTFIRNIAEHPEDPKYRSINTESGAFKSKLAPLVGPAILLQAVGFERDYNEQKYKFTGTGDESVLIVALTKLTEAEELYRAQNP